VRDGTAIGAPDELDTVPVCSRRTNRSLGTVIGGCAAGGLKTPAMPSGRSHLWQIYMLRSEAHHLGVVEALDIVSAIKVAIKKFGIAEGEQRKLFALRVD